MTRVLIAFALWVILGASAFAASAGVTLYGTDNQPLGTSDNPLKTSAAPGAVSTVSVRGAPALVAKASAGSLIGFTVTEGGTAGYFALLDASTAPATGTTIAPAECIPVAVNGTFRARQSFGEAYNSGIVILSTSSCTTYTAVTPQVMEGVVQ